VLFVLSLSLSLSIQTDENIIIFHRKSNSFLQIFVIGGSQQLSQRQSINMNSNEQQISPNIDATYPSILNLPDEVYLHLFSFLNPIDLCQISNVCRKWYRLATDDNLWRQRLVRDMKSWPSISSRSNPLSYALVQSDRSQREIYLTCSPNIRRRPHQVDESIVNFSYLSNYVRSWFERSKDLIMFGPGLESYTSPLVKNLLWDESKRFQTMGMIPGNAGFVQFNHTLHELYERTRELYE
jgi:hypothetical protein